MNKRFILIIWIIGWSIVAIQQIPTTFSLISHSFNKKVWPPEGFVIVENRSGQKIMITEATDENFNPKNSQLCDDNFLSSIHSSIENNTLYLNYWDDI